MAPPTPAPLTNEVNQGLLGFVTWLVNTRPELLSSYANTSGASVAFLSHVAPALSPAPSEQLAAPAPPLASAPTSSKSMAPASRPAPPAHPNARDPRVARTAAPRVSESRDSSRSRVRSRSPARSCAAPVEASSESEMEVDVAIAGSSQDSEGFVRVTSKGKKRSLAKAAAAAIPPAKAGRPASAQPNSVSAATAPQASQAAATAPPAAGTPQAANGRKEKPPPPLFIQDKGRWEAISTLLNQRGIRYTHARTTQLGIKVQMGTANDHRAATRLLRTESVGFHTYALEEEKVLRTVMRGIPKEVDAESVRKDLHAQGYPVKEVHRLYGKDRTPYDLLLVVLDRTPEGKTIFNITKVLGLSGISIEAPHRNGAPSQCHRCQLYGHSARFCFARPRCVKCLGDHGTSDCVRTRDSPDPPSCVLCGNQGHTANYRGCPRAPRSNKKPHRPPPGRRNPQSPKLSYVPAPPPKENAWAKPLGKAQPATAPAPAAPAPAPAPAIAPYRPPPARVPQPFRPAPPLGHSDLESDLALVFDFANAIDIDEVRVLAQKLRTARSQNDRLRASLEHAGILSAIKHYSVPLP